MRTLIAHRLSGGMPSPLHKGPFRYTFKPGEPSIELPLQPGEKLKPAAVLVPLIDRPEGITVLLTERGKRLHHHAGQISFPGGRTNDTDDGPIDTALRETEEEVGVARAQVEIIGCLEPIVTLTGFHVTPVVGFVSTDHSLKLDPFEVEAAFEVPLDFILDPDNHEPRTTRFRDRDISYYALQYDGRVIWGATAWILVNLYHKLANKHLER